MYMRIVILEKTLQGKGHYLDVCYFKTIVILLSMSA